MFGLGETAVGRGEAEEQVQVKMACMCECTRTCLPAFQRYQTPTLFLDGHFFLLGFQSLTGRKEKVLREVFDKKLTTKSSTVSRLSGTSPTCRQCMCCMFRGKKEWHH